MTYPYVSSDAAAWKQAIEELRTAEAELEKLTAADENAHAAAVHDRVDRAKDKVLGQPAPDFDGVIAKLHILLAPEIDCDLEAYDGHRIVVGDIYRLTKAWG